MSFTDWFWTHFLQEDYYQFYILAAIGLIYLELRFRKIMKELKRINLILRT